MDKQNLCGFDLSVRRRLKLLTFLNSNKPFIFIFLEIDNSFLFLHLLTFCSKSVFLNIVFFHQFVTKIGMNKIRPLKSIKICQIKVNIIKLCFSACLLRLIILIIDLSLSLIVKFFSVSLNETIML